VNSTIHTTNGHLTASLPESVPAEGAALEGLALAGAFASTVARYLLLVLPQARGEMRRWENAALRIPDTGLRWVAEQALAKRGNIEGAALLATLAPASHRSATVRALVAFQSAYNYLDALSELGSPDPRANANQLHQALLVALDPTQREHDYYLHNPRSEDGGYLSGMLDACRHAVLALPSYRTVADQARLAAKRIVDFQTLNRARGEGGHAALESWAGQIDSGGLTWWEAAAGAGSSLAVHALIASAADRHLEPVDAAEIYSAYSYRVGALHSLLDSLVDRGEDDQQGRQSLLEHYSNPAHMQVGLHSLATGSRKATRHLDHADTHRVILTAMCSYYLSAPECETPEGHAVTATITDALGFSLSAAIALFRVRRRAHTLTGRTYV
jgi:tetraprenyl-beta-curcumene synthase